MTDDVDFSGSRRLTGGEEWFWYVFAGATYVVAGIWHKWILNWLMGPIWLVTVVVVGPWLVDRVRDVVAGDAGGGQGGGGGDGRPDRGGPPARGDQPGETGNTP